MALVEMDFMNGMSKNNSASGHISDNITSAFTIETGLSDIKNFVIVSYMKTAYSNVATFTYATNTNFTKVTRFINTATGASGDSTMNALQSGNHAQVFNVTAISSNGDISVNPPSTSAWQNVDLYWFASNED